MNKKYGLATAACIFDTKRYVALYWYHHSHNEIRLDPYRL
jgi:hypothetical protein